MRAARPSPGQPTFGRSFVTVMIALVLVLPNLLARAPAWAQNAAAEPADTTDQAIPADEVVEEMTEPAAVLPADEPGAEPEAVELQTEAVEEVVGEAVDEAVDEPAAVAAPRIVADNATDEEPIARAETVVPTAQALKVKDNEQGSVKVNGVDSDDIPSNEPHLGCVFDVSFYGFDPAVTPSGAVTFVTQMPTANDQPLVDHGVVPFAIPAGEDLQGNTLVGQATYDLGSVLAPYTPHPIQGYHIKLSVVTGDEQNAKHKVFWVRCSGEPVPDHGTLSVTKAVEGEAPAVTTFDFTVTGPQGYSAGFTLPNAGSWTWTDAVPPGDYVVTETGTGDATTTTVSVDGGDPLTGTAADVTVVKDMTTDVAFVNTFNPEAEVGELAIFKTVEGAIPAGTTFDFTVTGPNGYAEAFSLPTADDLWTWRAQVGVGDYVVTELGTGDADITTVSVDGSDPAESTTADTTVLAETSTEVAFVNEYVTVPPAEYGELVVAKTAEGDTPEDATFDFTVTGPNDYLAAFSLPTATDGWSWSDEVGVGDYVVTEVGTGDADITTVSVDGSDPVESTTADAAVLTEASTEVAFVNEYALVPPGPGLGDLVVTKAIEGSAPADASFEFTVTGPNGYSAAFTLPTAGNELTWSDEVVVGDYSVTEVTTSGADLTTVTVDEGETVEATTADVTVGEGTTTVAFVNDFGEAGGVPGGPTPTPTPIAVTPGPVQTPLPAPTVQLPSTGLGVALLVMLAGLATLLGTGLVATARRR